MCPFIHMYVHDHPCYQPPPLTQIWAHRGYLSQSVVESQDRVKRDMEETEEESRELEGFEIRSNRAQRGAGLSPRPPSKCI